MWFPNAFWPAFLASSFGLAILIIIIKAGIRRPGNLPAFALFLSFFLWSFGEMLERIAGPPPSDRYMAFLGVKILFIGIAFSPAAFIHFSVEYPYMIKIRKNILKISLYALYLISFVFSLMGAFNPYNLIFQGVSPYIGLGQMIWGLDQAPLYVIYSLYVLLAALLFLIIMIYKYIKTNLKIIKHQIMFSLFGFFLAVILVTLSALIPMLQEKSSYPLTTVSFSIFSLFVLYTIIKYRAFLVSPTSFSKTEEKGIFVMNRRDAESKFREYVKSGIPSMAFIIENPESFKRRNEIGDAPVFQITEKTGKDRLNPMKKEHREMMQFIVLSFSERAGNSVILMNIKDASGDMIPTEEYKRIIDDMKNLVKTMNVLFIVVE